MDAHHSILPLTLPALLFFGGFLVAKAEPGTTDKRTVASSEERLSASWSQDGSFIYVTTDQMPAGAELRIRVSEAGNGNGHVAVIVLDYHPGSSPHVKRFEDAAKGQILKYKLERNMRVGIIVGSPTMAACNGCEDKSTYHQLKYDFGYFGTLVLDTKVVSGGF